MLKRSGSCNCRHACTCVASTEFHAPGPGFFHFLSSNPAGQSVTRRDSFNWGGRRTDGDTGNFAVGQSDTQRSKISNRTSFLAALLAATMVTRLQRLLLAIVTASAFFLSHEASGFTIGPTLSVKKNFEGSKPYFNGGIYHSSSNRRILASCTSLSAESPKEESRSLSTPLDRPVLAFVDLFSLLLFAGVGKASHAPDGSLEIGAVFSVAFPFIVSWFLTSPITGVYTADNKNEFVIQDAFVKAGKGWIVAIPLGCVLRGVIKGYVPPLPFVIVTMIATLVILGGARVIFSVAEDFFVEMVN